MQYAVPAIIAMTASSLYNMVDSIFIGHGVGTMAISGLALTFPLMNLAAAFGSLVGVGAATLISVKLGQKDYDTAQRVLGNVFVLNILLGVAFTVVVMAFLDPILYFFGGSDETVGYARDYSLTADTKALTGAESLFRDLVRALPEHPAAGGVWERPELPGAEALLSS